jgi:peroxiredoxin
LLNNRTIFLSALIFFVVIIAFHVSSKKQPAGKEADKMFESFKSPIQWKDKYPPDFEIELMNGEKFRLSENIGKKVIVLNFFATWCEPCRDETPELNGFFVKHKNDPLVMISINEGEGRQKVRAFIEEYQVGFPVAIDRNEAVQKLFNVRGFPTTIYVGADGKVKVYETGPVMNADIAFDTQLAKDLAALRSGDGIQKEVFLEKIRNPQNLPAEERKEADKDGVQLTGRAKTISEKMYCPCGCSDILSDCNCRTAKEIREKLKTQDWAGKSDEDIIKELDREFCVKGGKVRHD